MQKILILLIVSIITVKVGAQTSTFYVQQADSLFRVGNYSKAILAYEQVGSDTHAMTQIAKAYKALGNNKKALHYYEKSLQLDSLNTLVLYDYGKLLFTSGTASKSLTVFEKLIRKDTLNPNFHYHEGLAKEALASENYIASFEKTYQLDAQHQKSIYKLIVYHLERKDFDNTLLYIKAGLENNSEDIKITGFYAQYFYALKQYRKALLWFEKLINRKKATRYVFEKAAFSAYKAAKILKAIAYYEEALQLDPGNYFYHSQLAKLYYQDGIIKKAEHHASQAIAAKMIDASGDFYILGLVAFDRKEYQQAMKLFKMVLKENPEHEAAQFQMALVADNLYKDLKEKLKMYERFLEKFPKANENMTKIIRVRIRELKEEIHLKSE